MHYLFYCWNILYIEKYLTFHKNRHYSIRRRLTVRDYFCSSRPMPVAEWCWVDRVCTAEWGHAFTELTQLFVTCFCTLYPENPLSLLPRILCCVEPPFTVNLKQLLAKCWSIDAVTSFSWNVDLLCCPLFMPSLFRTEKTRKFWNKNLFTEKKIKRD